jgi:hypothetical protein
VTATNDVVEDKADDDEGDVVERRGGREETRSGKDDGLINPY